MQKAENIPPFGLEDHGLVPGKQPRKQLNVALVDHTVSALRIP